MILNTTCLPMYIMHLVFVFPSFTTTPACSLSLCVCVCVCVCVQHHPVLLPSLLLLMCLCVYYSADVSIFSILPPDKCNTSFCVYWLILFVHGVQWLWLFSLFSQFVMSSAVFLPHSFLLPPFGWLPACLIALSIFAMLLQFCSLLLCSFSSSVCVCILA